MKKIESFFVRPAVIAEVRKRGGLTYQSDILQLSKYRRLKKTKKGLCQKQIWIVPYKESFGGTRYLRVSKFLARYGLKICDDAPHYLLGFVACVSRKQLPKRLRGTNIVAVGSQHSVFKVRSHPRSALFARKESVGKAVSTHLCFIQTQRIRTLLLIRRKAGPNKNDFLPWAFLAEKL